MIFGLLYPIVVNQLHKDYLQVQKLEASNHFLHPAHFVFVSNSGRHQRVILKGSMSVSAYSSPAKQFVIASATDYAPPAQRDGYGGIDIVSERGNQKLALYNWMNNQLRLVKIFNIEASWTPLSWSKNEDIVLLHASPKTMVIEKIGDDKLFILNTRTLDLKEIWSATDIDWAEFTNKDTNISVNQRNVIEDVIHGQWRRTNERSIVYLDLKGQQLSKYKINRP